MFSPSGLSYYIISLGCSKNLVDSEKINGGMISAGFSPAESAEESDIIIINTCGFIRDAKEESIEVIFDAVSLKEDDADAERLFMDHGKRTFRNFNRKIVVTGCLSKRYFNDIMSDIPEIDFLYGIPDDNFIPGMCGAFGIKVSGSSEAGRVKIHNSYPYSYLKISDGCSNNCSYCAIPLIRGPLVNFSPGGIIREAEQCVDAGALELNIIAQDITSYNYEGMNLPRLVEKISKIEKLQWIRLLYCHPDKITGDIISLFSSDSKVVPYIDIPFQHVSARILESMGRKGDSGIYAELIGRIRKAAPSIRIRTTFMTGYPGENESEFRELIDFISTMKLDRVGCFTYSPEDDTRACMLEDTVAQQIKQERYDRIMSLQREISRQKLEMMTGMELDVLVEERVDENMYTGRTAFDAPEVDGVFYLTADIDPVNTIVRARVTDTTEYDLFGEII
ncbi:MAG: 30S ribosomal protein S12 methylthiotransferase RimO [Spirochaetes bacterium]|nr:30S ribosomal protein S12 methylthiotransferase RimO [Spirochaetota bacterium]